MLLHGRQLVTMELSPAKENILLYINSINHWPIKMMTKNKNTQAMFFKY